MSKTITFTARSQKEKRDVVTFTLLDDTLRINLTGLLQPVEDLSDAEAVKAEAKQALKKQIKPGLMKLSENLSGPIHVSDVRMTLNERAVSLTVWKRLAGLRMAPIRFRIEQVDNPDAAAAFLSELETRKNAVAHAGKFFGPLDYWAGWMCLFGIFILLLRWPRKKASNNAKEEEE